MLSSPACPPGPIGCLLRAGNLSPHFPPPAPVRQKPIHLHRRLAQLGGHCGAVQAQDTQSRRTERFLLSAPSTKHQEAAFSCGTPGTGCVALSLPPSLRRSGGPGSVLGHPVRESAPPQPPSLCCRVRSTGLSIPAGLGEFCGCAPYGLQPQPHGDASGDKAGLCLPPAQRVGVSVTPTLCSVNSLPDAPSLPLPGTATA